MALLVPGFTAGRMVVVPGNLAPGLWLSICILQVLWLSISLMSTVNSVLKQLNYPPRRRDAREHAAGAGRRFLRT